eukprot:352911-Chlamydomonas_euryale.AAC.6
MRAELHAGLKTGEGRRDGDGLCKQALHKEGGQKVLRPARAELTADVELYKRARVFNDRVGYRGRAAQLQQHTSF